MASTTTTTTANERSGGVHYFISVFVNEVTCVDINTVTFIIEPFHVYRYLVCIKIEGRG